MRRGRMLARSYYPHTPPRGPYDHRDLALRRHDAAAQNHHTASESEREGAHGVGRQGHQLTLLQHQHLVALAAHDLLHALAHLHAAALVVHHALVQHRVHRRDLQRRLRLARAQARAQLSVNEAPAQHSLDGGTGDQALQAAHALLHEAADGVVLLLLQRRLHVEDAVLARRDRAYSDSLE